MKDYGAEYQVKVHIRMYIYLDIYTYMHVVAGFHEFVCICFLGNLPQETFVNKHQEIDCCGQINPDGGNHWAPPPRSLSPSI